jgi:tryptophanyl-tRNA synthetase
MKRVLSGIRANSDLTIGNYLGALKPWVQLQNSSASDDTEYIFFIPNLHSLMGRPDPRQLHQNTLSNVAWYLAAGLDASRAILFVQSQVSAHAEMSWIFDNYVTMGELSRMTQYKDKARGSGEAGQLVSLFIYPSLMAADILLYDTNEVPVGDDQKQHVELARDIAVRFNNLYGETFVVPEATLPAVGARIMNLQNPTSKMSKSDEDQSGNIMLSDSPEVMAQKIKRSVTDSGSEIVAGKDKPAITNLLQLFAAVTDRSVVELEADYRGKGYGDFKADLADAVVAHLEPIQQRHDELMHNQSALMAILEDGRDKAALIAEAKLAEVKQLLGLL